MVTKEKAKEYLKSQGINLPDFVLDALVEQVNSVQECLDANYPASTALLIQLYLLGLMGLGQGDKYISLINAAARHTLYPSRMIALISLRPSRSKPFRRKSGSPLGSQ